MLNVYPIMIHIEKFPILVVGGGKVAYRKVKILSKYTKNIKVIAKTLHKNLLEHLTTLNLAYDLKDFEFNDLDNIKLCICATDNTELNNQISIECNKRNILCNNVNDPSQGHFQLPAVFDDGHLIISTSTKGASPMLARKLRDKIKSEYNNKYTKALNILDDIREEYNLKLPEQNKQNFWDELTDSILYNENDLKNVIQQLTQKYFI